MAVVRESLVGVPRDDVPFYAAGIAFHSLFSIFALLFLLSLLLGLFGADPDNLRKLGEFTSGVVPGEAGDFVDEILDVVSRPVPSGLFHVAILFTLWTASNVVQALIHALHRIYHLRENVRAAWRTRLMALAVVGVSALLITLGLVLLLFGGDLSTGLIEIQRVRTAFIAWALAARQPLSVLAVFLGAHLLYWLAPSFKHKYRVAWPGALCFTLLWAVATMGFNFYLREIAVYNKIYGPMATVVVFLVWVYLSAFLFLYGGEVNTAIHRWKTRDSEDRLSALR